MAASGAISASVSNALATVSGAVTSTTSRSLALGPRTDRRTASVLCARSAARSRVITASDRTRPATGSTTVSATAAIMTARPAIVFGRAGGLAGGPNWPRAWGPWAWGPWAWGPWGP